MVEKIPEDKTQPIIPRPIKTERLVSEKTEPAKVTKELAYDSKEPRNSVIKGLKEFFRKIWERTRNLPGAKGIAVTQGSYKGSRFNLITIDSRCNEALVYMAPSDPAIHKFKTRSLEFIASKYPNIHVVINGTYFNHTDGNSKADNQPLGPVIYRQGKYWWTPTTKSHHGKPVYSFNRLFFAIDKNYKPVIEYSQGRRAEELMTEGYLELLGGGAPLIYNGEIVVTKETLEDQAHISPSTHQMYSPRQRSAIGISETGKILIATFGYQGDRRASSSGIKLPDLAEFMKTRAKARYAMCLDSGTSTGMYISDENCKSTGIPREQSTYIMFVSKDTAKLIKGIELRREIRLKEMKLEKAEPKFESASENKTIPGPEVISEAELLAKSEEEFSDIEKPSIIKGIDDISDFLGPLV